MGWGIFKALNGLSPVFVAELFKSSHIRYSLRSGHKLILAPANTVTYGTRSLTFMGSILWNWIPKSIKYSSSFLEFKNSLKKLSTKISFCYICKDYFNFCSVDFYKYSICNFFHINVNFVVLIFISIVFVTFSISTLIL